MHAGARTSLLADAPLIRLNLRSTALVASSQPGQASRLSTMSGASVGRRGSPRVRGGGVHAVQRLVTSPPVQCAEHIDGGLEARLFGILVGAAGGRRHAVSRQAGLSSIRDQRASLTLETTLAAAIGCRELRSPAPEIDHMSPCSASGLRLSTDLMLGRTVVERIRALADQQVSRRPSCSAGS